LSKQIFLCKTTSNAKTLCISELISLSLGFGFGQFLEVVFLVSRLFDPISDSIGNHIVLIFEWLCCGISAIEKFSLT